MPHEFTIDLHWDRRGAGECKRGRPEHFGDRGRKSFPKQQAGTATNQSEPIGARDHTDLEQAIAQIGLRKEIKGPAVKTAIPDHYQLTRKGMLAAAGRER